MNREILIRLYRDGNEWRAEVPGLGICGMGSTKEHALKSLGFVLSAIEPKANKPEVI